jgi:hypothetical protein
MSILLLFLLSILSGFLYRIGGSDLKVPFKTKFRDLGVPLCGLVCLLNLLPNTSTMWLSVALVGYFILSFGSMTTYWDKWGTDDVEWYEWALTGLCYGLASFPIAIYTGQWIGFVIRAIILMVFMPFSNKLQFKILSDGTDGVEGSRGFMFVLTMPLLVL